jgi:lipopolysaccharide export LptBFGC system permease protein LptF
VIVYWYALRGPSALGEQSLLPPFLAAWSPNLMFALAGGYLFLSTRS